MFGYNQGRTPHSNIRELNKTKLSTPDYNSQFPCKNESFSHTLVTWPMFYTITELLKYHFFVLFLCNNNLNVNVTMNHYS